MWPILDGKYCVFLAPDWLVLLSLSPAQRGGVPVVSGSLAPPPTVRVSPEHYGIAYSASAPGEEELKKQIIFSCSTTNKGYYR